MARTNRFRAPNDERIRRALATKMNDEGNKFLAEFEKVIKYCERLCYATTAEKHQREAIAKLGALYAEIDARKTRAIVASDEDYANCLLSIGLVTAALEHELNMWVALKEDNSALAWDELIEAQTCATNSVRAHAVAHRMIAFVERLERLEAVLFPPMIFVSLGMIIHASKCSVCDSEYGDCSHIKGLPYMGQMCVRKITEFKTIERSIVPNPANKHARMAAISDGNTTRDLLTWRTVPNDPMEYVKGIYGDH
jgi:hypothetical protein